MVRASGVVFSCISHPSDSFGHDRQLTAIKNRKNTFKHVLRACYLAGWGCFYLRSNRLKSYQMCSRPASTPLKFSKSVQIFSYLPEFLFSGVLSRILSKISLGQNFPSTSLRVLSLPAHQKAHSLNIGKVSNILEGFESLWL